MTQRDYETFTRLLDSIRPLPEPWFYPESDGDLGRVEHYICHTHGGRIDCASRAEARGLAASLNQINTQPFSP